MGMQSRIPLAALWSGEPLSRGAPSRHPRLLFLAFPFPPYRAAGCVRTWNLARYLARSSWDVTVVTPHPSVWRSVEDVDGTRIALEREGIRRILTGHQWRCLAPENLNYWNQGFGWLVGGLCRKIARPFSIDKRIGWMKAAESACSHLTANDVDVILATGSPFAAFKLAGRLSERLGRPYVLDYRDPWTGNPHAARPARPTIIREEARLLEHCAAVTIVSPSWSSAMDARFHLGPKLHVVTNGYDPEELVRVKPQDFDHFAIVYTGSFYPPKRVISPVMDALKRFKGSINGSNKDWRFHYFGEHEHHIREQARRYEVMEKVVLHGKVPRAQALSAIRGAKVAVVITSVADEICSEDQVIVPGKIFDTIGLGTPMLLIAPPGSDVEHIIETTRLGRRFSGSDIEGMTSFLFARVSGQAYEPKDLGGYAWNHIVAKMDAVLRKAMQSTSKAENAFHLPPSMSKA
jgi:glycosyltransferase involved in cell wall biosynthesis